MSNAAFCRQHLVESLVGRVEPTVGWLCFRAVSALTPQLLLLGLQYLRRIVTDDCHTPHIEAALQSFVGNRLLLFSNLYMLTPMRFIHTQAITVHIVFSHLHFERCRACVSPSNAWRRDILIARIFT